MRNKLAAGRVNVCRGGRGRPGALSADARYRIFKVLRDWTPLAFTLAAFRETDWFTPALYT